MEQTITPHFFHESDIPISETSHLAVGAHPDDLEIMASHGITQCYNKSEQQFSGVVVTDGAGSVKSENLGEAESIVEIRQQEQLAAAKLGQYLGMWQLAMSSTQVKTHNAQVVDALKKIINESSPKYIYSHNPADKHLTHVGVFYNLLQALRELEYQPEQWYGCEVWRNLDWINDENKIPLPIECDDQFVLDLVGCHKSQSVDGKKFHAATLGRMKANASFFEASQNNLADKVWFAIDLKPLLQKPYMSVEQFLDNHIAAFKNEVCENLHKFR